MYGNQQRRTGYVRVLPGVLAGICDLVDKYSPAVCLLLSVLPLQYAEREMK